MADKLPERVALSHTPPPWARAGERFFITICCAKRNVNQLCTLDRSQALIESAKAYHKMARWHLTLFLLMPDHLHCIASFPPEASIRNTLRAWKSFHARQLHVEWQSGFFDHRLRNDQSANEKYRYILANPVRASLVDHENDWPHRWVPDAR